MDALLLLRGSEAGPGQDSNHYDVGSELSTCCRHVLHTMGNMILAPYTIDGLSPLEPDIPWTIAEQLLKASRPIGRDTPPRLRPRCILWMG